MTRFVVCWYLQPVLGALWQCTASLSYPQFSASYHMTHVFLEVRNVVNPLIQNASPYADHTVSLWVGGADTNIARVRFVILPHPGKTNIKQT